ncbi:MAG: hypothetical protein ABI634_10335 [Acidobacteriota bacterium]
MSRRQELLLALTAAAVLVLFRSLVFIAYEQAFFDSDQAIVGLMAKHLVEGRAFPLFYYGQTYMLVVDAWIAAPFFLIAGPTVAALHAATTAVNVITAMLVVIILSTGSRLRPLATLIPASFFALASPLLGRSLIEAGANIGPLLYVPLLWLLRRRPLWFGLVLGIGILNREFTVYVVPALLAGEVWARTLWQPARVKHWLVVGVATVATMQAIQALKPVSDMMGPGTRGALVGGEAGSQVGNIRDRVALEPREFPARARVMLGSYLPGLLGAASSDVTSIRTGHSWMFWPLGFGLLIAFGRAVVLTRRAPSGQAAPAWYLAGVGALAVVTYVATRPAEGVVIRYLLLAVYVPVGIVAAHLTLETRRGWRAVSIIVATMCATTSVVDHGRLLEHFVRGRESNETRDLANALEARGIRVAESGYWRAYKVSFLTRERVKVASTDVVRIEEYQRLAREAGSTLVSINETSCPGGERVSAWYLCRQE